jgi:hypothetical protein
MQKFSEFKPIPVKHIPVTCNMHRSTKSKLLLTKDKKTRRQMHREQIYASDHLCYTPQRMHKSRYILHRLKG